jgi:response regulator NasT
MSGLRILLAEDEVVVAEGLARMLQGLGHQVLARAGSGREAVRLAGRLSPDVILMDIKMPDLDGLAAAREIMGASPGPIVFLTGHAERELLSGALECGALGYLLKPVAATQLEAALAVACKRFSEIADLKAEQARLQQLLEERKLVERAKGVLMEKLGLSEEAAYRRLQKQARDTNQRLADLARALLSSHGLLTTAGEPQGGARRRDGARRPRPASRKQQAKE